MDKLKNTILTCSESGSPPLPDVQGQFQTWDPGGTRNAMKSTRTRHLDLEEVPLACQPWYVEDPNDYHPETHQKIGYERGEMPEETYLSNFKDLQCRHCGWTGPSQRRKQHVYTHLGYKPYYCEKWCVKFSSRNTETNK
jgi:hypothetical protein